MTLHFTYIRKSENTNTHSIGLLDMARLWFHMLPFKSETASKPSTKVNIIMAKCVNEMVELQIKKSTTSVINITYALRVNLVRLLHTRQLYVQFHTAIQRFLNTDFLRVAKSGI